MPSASTVETRMVVTTNFNPLLLGSFLFLNLKADISLAMPFGTIMWDPLTNFQVKPQTS